MEAMANAAHDAPVVEFWDKPYLQKYRGTSDEPLCSLVDCELLYNALDRLTIKVAGETTGVPSTDFFDGIERPDFRNPFPVIVSYKIHWTELVA